MFGVPIERSAAMIARLTRNAFLRQQVAVLTAAYLKLALGTTVWRRIGWQHIPDCGGAVFACWHERLALTPWFGAHLARRAGGVRVMISRSHDGRLIADVVGRFAIAVAYGSSSRDGAAALRALARDLAAGSAVGLTPDGPRGPRRRAQLGTARLAALTGAPIIPCAAWTTRGFTVRSWDQMRLPLPFARGAVVCGPPIKVPRVHWRDALDTIETALDKVAEEAKQAAEHPGAKQAS